MQLSSKFIQAAVDQMASLPGIGRKTALRLVLSLVKRDRQKVERFASAFMDMMEHVTYCERCHNLSDDPLCTICSNPNREDHLICVVEDIQDVMAIEGTQQFKGVYHVLGGRISPMDGIGPQDLNIASLMQRLESKEQPCTEIILALSATMEGDTTGFYLYRKVQDLGIALSTLARGVGVGTELEYADEITLGRSILDRTPYEASLSR